VAHKFAEEQKILLLGASFETGNLGVGALAEASIGLLRRRYGGTGIVLFGEGYEPGTFEVPIGAAGERVGIRRVPVRFCRDVRLPYHFVWFAGYGLIGRLLPRRWRHWWWGRNRYCAVLRDAEVAAEITGGDSFSDLYGMRRFVLGFLRRWLVLLYGKRLVMLPQTYGPFRRRISRAMGRYVLRRAEVVYCRDREGVEYVRELVGERAAEKVRFSPDVAFALEPREPAAVRIVPDDGVLRREAEDVVIVGLNVSGLLYHERKNREAFRLATDYRELVVRVAETLLADERCRLLLVPHVFPPQGFEYEDDPAACRAVYDVLAERHAGRVFTAEGPYDQAEAKWLIGRCDFFAGSRMHACIAALSQGIPAVGLAYSKKFAGVFESVGAGELVVDLRDRDTAAVVEAVVDLFARRDEWRGRLGSMVEGLIPCLDSLDGAEDPVPVRDSV